MRTEKEMENYEHRRSNAPLCNALSSCTNDSDRIKLPFLQRVHVNFVKLFFVCYLFLYRTRIAINNNVKFAVAARRIYES